MQKFFITQRNLPRVSSAKLEWLTKILVACTVALVALTAVPSDIHLEIDPAWLIKRRPIRQGRHKTDKEK